MSVYSICMTAPVLIDYLEILLFYHLIPNFMANQRTTGRIVYPKNAADWLTLAASVYTKHTADGNNSPIKNLADYDWSVTGPNISRAQEVHREAEALRKQAEEKYAERDRLMQGMEEITRKSGSLLKSMNAKNPKRLQDWGYTVDDSPPAPKAPKP